MFRKIAVLATAVGVVMAVALPVPAASGWLHHYIPTQQDLQLGLTGIVRMETGVAVVDCQVTSTAKFTVSTTTGHIETFAPHPTDATTNCLGRGSYAMCQIHEMKVGTLPMTFHASGGKLWIWDFSMTVSATGLFCPIKHIETTLVTRLAPQAPSTVSQFFIEPFGCEVCKVQTANGTVHNESVTVLGELKIEAPNANTYSF